MHNLIISVSGVRGIYGDGLTEEIAGKFAYAFGTLYNGSVVVGRDSRKSGETLARAVISGLRKAGTDVVNLGLASTPTTEMAVTEKKADGGVIVTASHNPAEWNGLKFFGPDGVFLDSSSGEKVLEVFHSAGDISKKSPSGSLSEWEFAGEYHIDSIISLDMIDSSLIASKKFTVCLDTVNGAGGPVCTNLLERLGCEIFIINGEPTGDFPHGAEPVPENICDLCSLVRERNADIGFAVDPDVDRLSIVNESGEALGEEYSLALAADYCMESMTKTAACNLSTSQMIDNVAASHGGIVHRSPVGEINVVQKMRETGAGIGGEGNGGIILPALHYGRDAVLGIALMLQYMAERGERISALANSIPHYSMIKEKMEITHKGAWIEPLKEAFRDEEMDLCDGIKIILENSWVHIRESNTEPIIRIIAEAPTREEAQDLLQRVYGAIGQC